MSIKFGIHPFIWTSQWDNSSLDLIDRAKDIGFDFIEIPLVRLDLLNPKKVKERLKSTDMKCCTSVGLTDETDITSEDKNIRESGVKFLKECVIAADKIGAGFLTGVTYSSFGKKPGRPPTEKEWEFSASCLREVARFASKYNVLIGIEAINRYETYLINTAQQAKKLIKMIDEPNVKIHLDTYHMNIEEKNFYEVIKSTGDMLLYIHLCENDRGIPGTGHIEWDEIFRALKEINYSGWVAIESFISVIPEIAAATCIWRQLTPDGDTLAKEGLKFLKTKAREYSLV